ncbi:MAG: DUF3857 domain-containing protein [Myxococcota bacterium]
MIRIFLLVSALLPAVAQAQNPANAEQRRHAAEALRQGRAANGVLPLLELHRSWNWADPAVSLAELERLAASPRLPPARRAYVGALLARAQLRSGQPEASTRTLDDLGYINEWQIIGPFSNEGKQGFDQAFPPEAGRNEAPDPDARYAGRERSVGWRTYPSATTSYRYVNFDAVHRPFENVCSYAETFIETEREQPVSIAVGAGGAVKVWWNGEEVISDDAYRQPDPDRHLVGVIARRGYNRALVKVCVAESTWGFFFRLGDASGGPAPSHDVSTTYHALGPAARGSARPLRSVLDELEANAEGERATASALEHLARFLAYTGADDPAEQRARQLAARAAELAPTVERLLLAAELANERGEVMRFAERAFRLAPSDPRAKLLRGRVLSGGPSPEDALPILRSIPRASLEGLAAARIEARYLRSIELVDAARGVIERAAARAPNAPGWHVQRAVAANAAGRHDQAIDHRRAAVAARYDDTSSRRILATDALRRRERATVLEQVEALATLEADRARTLQFIAVMQEGLGNTDEALAALQRGRSLAPENASVLASLGRLQLRLQQPDAAIASLTTALDLQPQDADTRELLEQIRPQNRVDEAYAIDRDALLARRVERSGFPTTVLQQLTVNTVFQNGLGSRFVQWAAQVHDQEGARQLRTYSIQLDPDTQRVDVRQARVHRADGSVLEATQTFERQLGEPWYRIYYDTRALVVVFPDLEPGDTVEIQYRLDDVAHRNLFADYFGDMHFLQGFSPIQHLEYVLITPESREFYFNEPTLEGLRHERNSENGTRTDRFIADRVPAIRSEAGMPGMTEIAPYLHVSTYRTWEDVGRWWWGLIQDQLQADDNLRQVVRDLVRGAPDTATKVTRIHNWVVRNTRYVGLEFGIHGYKPYRVPLIVQRGFGDCKDKASLLYTMFREAGIDARIVLVRTRRNGAIRDLPASLAVFDHAIAYVPELDLYLDGTAEHSGTQELPSMDQGVTVLVVGPEDAQLTRTPVLGPDRNRRVRTLSASLSDDGSAEIEVEETIRGSEAPRYRSQYAPEGTREERFERSLRNIFPGLVLESQTMEHLESLEDDIELRYRARVPQFSRVDGQELRVAPSVLGDLLRSLARTPERRHPLDLGGTSSYREERTLSLPNRRSAQAPQGGTAESRFGRLELSVETQGNRVRARTDFELREDRIAPADYPAFRQWVEEADALLRQRINVGADQ